MGLENMKPSILFVVLLLIIKSSLQGGDCEINQFSGTFSKENIAHLLKNINQKRADLANGKVKANDGVLHPVANMEKIYCNNDLAKKAQEFADQLVKECSFHHNRNPYIGKEGWPVGEIISKKVSFKRLTPQNHLNTAIDIAFEQCWEERHKFHKNLFDKKYEFDFKTGHFTQMAWAETSEIGCGYANYSTKKFPTNEIIVCDFAVEGNDIGRKPDIPGKACSKCHGLPCSKEFPGLCGADDTNIHKKVEHHTAHPGDHLFDPKYETQN